MPIKEYPGSTVHQFIAQRFGAATTVKERNVTVGATVTEVADNNPRRFYLLVVNNSIDYMAVSFTREVTATSGIILAPNGGSVALTAEEDGEATGYALYAIGIAVGGTVRVIEGVTV